MQEPGHLREFDVDFTIVSMFQFLEWTSEKTSFQFKKFVKFFL